MDERQKKRIEKMDLRSRNAGASVNNDVREDILLETNFDEDGALTLAHSTNPHYPYQTNKSMNKSQQQQQQQPNNQNPLLQRSRRSYYRSDTSIDRYSEYSLHGRRDPGRGNNFKTNFCPTNAITSYQLRNISVDFALCYCVKLTN